MVFEGFCGIYTTNKQASENEHAKPGHDQVMLQDAKVGTLIGVESHMYEDCPALFTTKSNEKTKLLWIDKDGFEMYIKDYLLAKHQKVQQFYQSTLFLRETKQTFRGLLRLVLMTEMKKAF